MGHQCCSKQKVKRELWSPEEDEKLLNFVTSHGHPSWSSVPKLAGLQRCGKSCRLRWINYLRPDLKRGSFTEEEKRTIIEVHRILGNKWAQIAKHLPGRTDNEVKNFWNSCIKKKLLSQGLDPNTHNLLPPRKHATSTSIAPKSNTFSILSNTNASQSSSNNIHPKKKQSSEVFTVNTIRPSNNKNIFNGPSFTVPEEIAHKKDVATNLAMVSSYFPHEAEVECLQPPSSMFGWSVTKDSSDVNGVSSAGCLDHLHHGFGLMDEASMWVGSGLEKTSQFDDQQRQQHITGEGVASQMSCAADHPDDHLQLQEINVAMDEADELQTLKRLQMGSQGFDHLAPFNNNGGSGFDFGFGDYDTILQSGMYSMDQVAWDIAN